MSQPVAPAPRPLLWCWRVMAVLCFAMVVGCESKPSAEESENAFKAYVAEHMHGLVGLASFKTTDGQCAEANGVKTCRLDYEGELKVQQPCYYGGSGDHFVLGSSSDERATGSAQPGDVLKIRGQVAFEKASSGWRLASAQIETTAVIAAVPPAVGRPTAMEPSGSGSNNIFGINGSGSGSPAPSIAPAVVPAPSPAVIHHDAPIHSPVVTAPPSPTITPAGALARRTKAREAVVRSLGANPAYQKAKAEVDADNAACDKLRAAGEVGTEEMQSARQKWLAATGALNKVIDAAAARDSAFQEAQREYEAALSQARGK